MNRQTAWTGDPSFDPHPCGRVLSDSCGELVIHHLRSSYSTGQLRGHDDGIIDHRLTPAQKSAADSERPPCIHCAYSRRGTPAPETAPGRSLRRVSSHRAGTPSGPLGDTKTLDRYTDEKEKKPSRNLPKVRVSSPPSWPTNPSAKAGNNKRKAGPC